ncbi:HEAT repeat domain-containing protein [Listeria rocourtiae]|uniref:HEAT repeat domain-containing protein n=1 Tax=Listeria rocourtiae TaxID=647910 RepID=UPI0016269B4A|nr:HEAT repeat domain-containing protein [Listeria rocourtiae]MBC1435315.1 HEAT repeat domain-containing protein [Listeria rocourtiae]
MKHWDGWEEIREVLPSFDGVYLDTMSKFSYEVLELPPYYDSKVCLTAVFLYSVDGKMYDLMLRFIGISSLKMDMDVGFGDIQISPEQIEDIQFYVKDYEHGSVSFYCEAISYLGVEENTEESLKLALQKWRKLERMVEPDWQEVTETLDILVDFVDRPVVTEILLRSVVHENKGIRDSGYEYLWYLDDSRAFELACTGLKSEDALRRINCLEYLAKWGEAEIVPQLLDRVENDDDELVRCYAAEAVGHNAEAEAIPVLQRLLLQEQDDVAKIGMLYGLALLGYRELDSFFENLQNDYYIVRIRAALYLTEIARDDATVLPSIVAKLKLCRELEETVAVREALDYALDELAN